MVQDTAVAVDAHPGHDLPSHTGEAGLIVCWERWQHNVMFIF